jgi:hypothetical protein
MKKLDYSILNRDIGTSLRQMRQGKVLPAYSSAEEFIRHLHRRMKQLLGKKKS